MSKKISTIVKDVRICIDEIADNDAELEGDDDNLSVAEQDDSELTTIIKSKIAEALRFVYSYADYSMLEPSSVITTATNSTTNGITKSTVTFDEDTDKRFLRLVYATCSSWNGYVSQPDLIMWNDKEYPMLSDPYCTGTADRPKAAMTWNGKKKQIELYCLNGTGAGVQVAVMLDPGDLSEYDDNDELTIPEKIYRAFIYCVSGLVFVTYGDEQKSSMMFKEANELMGYTPSAQE